MVQKYPCALANVLEKAKNVDVLDGNWFISRKLDGCVDYCSNVEFDDGRVLPIGEVVRNKISGKVKSFDGQNIVYKDIEDWMEGLEDINPDKDWYEIETEDGKILKITGNDKVMTKNGWKCVCDLTKYDEILID